MSVGFVKPVWDLDLVTGTVRVGAVGATVLTTLPNVQRVSLAAQYISAPNGQVTDAWTPELVVTVEDPSEGSTILGQSSALGSNLAAIGCVMPTHEERSQQTDTIRVSANGGFLATLLQGAWPTAGVMEPLENVDAPFKAGV